MNAYITYESMTHINMGGILGDQGVASRSYVNFRPKMSRSFRSVTILLERCGILRDNDAIPRDLQLPRMHAFKQLGNRATLRKISEVVYVLEICD